MTDIVHDWKRIEQWLRDNAPETLRQFQGPAPSSALGEVARAVGELPADYVALMQIHDGVRNASFGAGVLEDFVLYSLDDALDAREEMLRVAQEGREAHPDIRDAKMRPAPGVRQLWWHEAWLPVAVAAGDSRTMILMDLDPAPSGVRGQLVRHVIEMRTLPVFARSVSEWVERVANAMEAGKVRVERQPGGDEDDPDVVYLKWPDPDEAAP